MPLRNWPASRIGRLWLWGAGAEVLLFALGVGLNARQEHRSTEPSLATPLRQLSAREADSIRQAAESSLAARGIELRQTDSSLTLAWNDSVSVTLDKRDTVSPLHLTAAAQREFEAAARPIALPIMVGVTRGIKAIMLTLALIFLPVPLALTVITVAWMILRHRGAVGGAS